jgi:S1-C subfamily serine protease
MVRSVFFVSGLVALSICPTLAGQPAKDNAQPRAYLGVAVAPATEKDQGVSIHEVAPNSPAAQAGLKNGDRVVKLNGQALRGVQEFIDAIAAKKPGDKVSIQVRRDGKEQTLNATLANQPPPVRLFPGQGLPGSDGGLGVNQIVPRAAFLGVQVERLNAERSKKLNVKGDTGVAVTDVVLNSPAAKAGLQRDDVILALDGKTVKTPQDLRNAVQRAGPGKDVTVRIQRGGNEKMLHASLENGPLGMVPWYEGGRFPSTDVESLWDHHDNVMEMQRRIDALERRINELEKKQSTK